MKKTKAWDAYNTIFAWAKTTPDARISLGGIDKKEQKHSILLENRYDTRHHILMGGIDSEIGLRTQIQAPEGIDVKCGQMMTREAKSEEFPDSKGNGAFVIQVDNGNLDIEVANGDLNIKAKNINFDIQGDADHDKDGNFTVNCNENIELTAGTECKIIATDLTDIEGTNMLRLFSNVETDFITGICHMTSYSSRRGKKSDLMEPEWYVPASMSDPVEEPPIGDTTPSLSDKIMDKAKEKFNDAKNLASDLKGNLTNKLPQPPGLSAFDEERISQMSNQGISREKAVELIKEHG